VLSNRFSTSSHDSLESLQIVHLGERIWSRKERRIGTTTSGPTLFESSLQAPQARSADCICANNLAQNISRSRISFGFQLLPRSSIAAGTGASLAVLPSHVSDGRSSFASSALIAPLRGASGYDDALFRFPGRVLNPSRQPWRSWPQPSSRGMFFGRFFARRDRPMVPVK